MRLSRRLAPDGERLIVAERDGPFVDATALGAGLPATYTELLAAGRGGIEALRAALADDARVARAAGVATSGDVASSGVPPIGRPGMILAVGRNYAEHAAEEGIEAPPAPVLFSKLPGSVIGPGAPITWRASHTGQVDYEAELAVVIGRRARDVDESEALGLVLGYTCLDDVSARDLQFGDGQWLRGKSLDTFCPIGPWLVTPDELPDPQALGIRCLVNDEVVQDSSTSRMIHGVAAVIAYASRYFTLEPGDVIATGTPGGVGVFREPPRFLADGDRVVVEIEGIGRLENPCRVLDG